MDRSLSLSRSDSSSCQSMNGDEGQAKSADCKATDCETPLDHIDSPGAERKQTLGEDPTAMTIEFLRARLLSERAASKAARQQAQQKAEKVVELQRKLEIEIGRRKKAESAAEDVLAKLKAKDLTDLTGCRGFSPDQQKCGNCKEDIEIVIKREDEPDVKEEMCAEVDFKITEGADCKQGAHCSDKIALLQREDDRCELQIEGNVSHEASLASQVLVNVIESQDNLNQSSQVCLKEVVHEDPKEAADKFREEFKDALKHEVEVAQQEDPEEALGKDRSELSDQGGERRLVIEEKLKKLWSQLEMAAVSEGQTEEQLVRLKLRGWVEHVVEMLEGKPHDEPIIDRSVSKNKMPHEADGHGKPVYFRNNPLAQQELSANDAGGLASNGLAFLKIHEQGDHDILLVNLKSESESDGAVESIGSVKLDASRSCEAGHSFSNKIQPQGNSWNVDSNIVPNTLPLINISDHSERSALFNAKMPDWLQGNEHMLLGKLEGYGARERLNARAHAGTGFTGSTLMFREGFANKRQIAREDILREEHNNCPATGDRVLGGSSKMREQSYSLLKNSGVDCIHLYRSLSDQALTSTGRYEDSMDQIGAGWLHTHTEPMIRGQGNVNGLVIQDHCKGLSEILNGKQYRQGNSQWVAEEALPGVDKRETVFEIYDRDPQGNGETHVMGKAYNALRQAEFGIQQTQYPDAECSEIDGVTWDLFQTLRPTCSQRVHSNDTDFGLLNERDGRVQNILMALHMAKNQIRCSMEQEDYISAQCPVVSKSTYIAKSHPESPLAGNVEPQSGCHFVEGQLGSYDAHIWSPNLRGYAPPLHETASSGIDYGFATVERHNTARKLQFASTNYTMPAIETFCRPRRKVHLGNGITLYTD